MSQGTGCSALIHTALASPSDLWHPSGACYALRGPQKGNSAGMLTLGERAAKASPGGGGVVVQADPYHPPTFPRNARNIRAPRHEGPWRGHLAKTSSRVFVFLGPTAKLTGGLGAGRAASHLWQASLARPLKRLSTSVNQGPGWWEGGGGYLGLIMAGVQGGRSGPRPYLRLSPHLGTRAWVTLGCLAQRQLRMGGVPRGGGICLCFFFGNGDNALVKAAHTPKHEPNFPPIGSVLTPRP